MAFIRSFWILMILISLTSCFDLITWETEIYGPYYVSDDPAASYKTLYYRGKDGLDAERFPNVSQVGYKSGYIFIKSSDRFYWFAVKDDKFTDLGDPAIKHLFSKPLSQIEFDRLLIALQIGEIDFQFQE